MLILAVTGFGQAIGLPAALCCVAWIAYLLVAPPPRTEPAKVAISWAFFLVTLAFAAIWFWMTLALPLTAWFFFIGDNEHWFYDFSPHIAAGVALLASLAAFLRTTWGTASRLYVRLLAWSPPLLLLAAAAVVAEDALSRVDGWTAQSAAQRILQTDVPRTNAAMRLEEHPGPPLYPDMPQDHRSFWIVEGGEKVGLITVAPNRLLGWHLSRSHRFNDQADVLVDAKVYLSQGDNQSARYFLEQVIANLPGTPTEQEARRMLANMPHDH